MLSVERLDSAMSGLQAIRKATGVAQTNGLNDETILRLLPGQPDLARAIAMAVQVFEDLPEAERARLLRAEKDLCEELQSDFMNFYPETGINPYVPMAARGPWIVSCYGAVLHDSGGYGMLGLGHNPPGVAEAIARPHVMANVMTPSLQQERFSSLLKAEIGHRREACPFSRFACLNSGSEAVTLATRIADIHAKNETAAGARHAGWAVRTLALKGGFHGRTDRPARMSECTRSAYEENLASFDADQGVDFIAINDIQALMEAFDAAEEHEIFYQAVFIEPVMGEGISGLAVTRPFYDAVRELSSEHGSLLVVDSIQAALRAHGCLSLIDYPGFEDCRAPDMETYSKALNAGQYPLSVLAMGPAAADTYVTGVYGNTMTTNPKALAVGWAVLESMDEDLRTNDRLRGRELLEGLRGLEREFPGAFLSVIGTGLLICAELNPERYRVDGRGGFEEYLRLNGIEMIHGGQNGLRFTPHLSISRTEIDLIVDAVRQGLISLADSF